MRGFFCFVLFFTSGTFIVTKTILFQSKLFLHTLMVYCRESRKILELVRRKKNSKNSIWTDSNTHISYLDFQFQTLSTTWFSKTYRSPQLSFITICTNYQPILQKIWHECLLWCMTCTMFFLKEKSLMYHHVLLEGSRVQGREVNALASLREC